MQGQFQQVRGWGGYSGGSRQMYTGSRGRVYHLSGGGNRVYHPR